ncbi:MAG: DUF885 domain-containing protein [Gammaproteobacteria bacterium]|nr:DUF885 domain-containing protein [Gammaproteobacteria bacterium]
MPTTCRIALFLAAAVAGCAGGPIGAQEGPAAPAAAQAQSSRAELVERETRRLNEWLDARYEEQLDFSPIQKTMLGRKDDYGELDDLSEAAEDEQLEWLRRSVRDLERSFDYELLTPAAQISYELWAYQLERAEAARPFRRHEYLFNQMRGWHTSLPQILIAFHRVDEDADAEAYVSRLGEAARALRQALERAKLAAAEGIRPPRFAYRAVLEQSRAVVSGAPFGGDGDSPLWADATSKIDALLEAGEIGAERAAALRAAARSALTGKLKPAYDELIAWLEQDLENTDEAAAGVWQLPEGEAYYEERLASSTTTDLTAEEIHRIGLAEVARIRTEMESIKEQVGFDGTLEEFFTFVREDPRFYFPSTDEGREAYLEAAREYLAYIEGQLPEWFGLLPRADLVVRRVEAFREQPGAAQHYVQGSPDGSRPGVYYAHLIDMGAMPKPQMEVIAYHEGIPGHHMQISIAQELTGVPMFRTQAFFNAYTEGWGLYAELLAKEMGAYRDPYSDFGRLTTEIWRAIRLVVDTGLHAKGWSEEQAVEYFTANSPAAEGQIRSEVQRYLVMPGQATGYKIGMLEILRLRDGARAALGDAFDIRGFHDAVLGGGALPLPILERRIDAWVDARRRTKSR